ncbi:hypothetical protein [Methylomonas sp. AM2-LC]|uniref:hypothetical protein n=1 Tax=Methylomonas sp. AM2-LC TaxID=3153301 RepID=UPI003264A62E
MKRDKHLLMAFIISITSSGCSTASFQQLGYFAVQNFGAYQCQKNMVSECNARPNYDEYQRQRGEIQKQ